MRLVRFLCEGRAAFGILEGTGSVRELEGPPFEGIRPGPATLPPGRVRLLSPVLPGKIVALGLNYREHIREMGHRPPEEPVIFLKPPSSVIGPGDEIVLPPSSRRVDFEAEMALVIDRRARRVAPERALEHVLGVTCLNDVTARDLQQKDGQWTRSKSFDTFCPLGPWVETEGAAEPRTVECLVNGEVRQSGSTGDLLFGPADIVAFVSGIMTLEAGDVIATGTPSGVGPLKPGDLVEVRLGGIGSLVNRVTAQAIAHPATTSERTI